MKKHVLSILLAILMVATVFTLSSCEILFPVDPPTDENDEAFKAVYELYVDYAASNEQTPDSYEDWLNSIRGEDGKDGKPGKDGEDGKDGADGKDGLTPSIGENGNWWIGDVDTGVPALPKNGEDGTDGKDGADGADGKDGVGIEKIEKISSEGLVDTYEITYTTGTKFTFTVTNGQNGVDGEDGRDGVDGTDGITPLLRITDGYWEVSYDNGITWISLGVKATGEQGPQGEPGKDGEDGKDGQDGADGVGIAKIEKISSEGLVDTYEITYTDGTKTIFTITNGANGTDGKDGADGEDGKDGVDGKPGQDGEDGKDGVDGEDGKDGVGISSAEVNADGELVLYFTNGTTINVGKVMGSDGQDGESGKDGTSVINSYVDDSLHLWIVLSDGTEIDAGYVGVKNEIIDPYPEITSPTIIVSSAEAASGDENVEIVVAIKNSPGITSILMNVEFNNSALELTNVTYNSEIGGIGVPAAGSESPIIIYWADGFNDVSGNFVFVTLTFKVSDTAETGNYSIKVVYSPDNIYNSSEEDVKLDIVNGSISVS